jgi:membrane fusion protein (multidrug efflux system)
LAGACSLFFLLALFTSGCGGGGAPQEPPPIDVETVIVTTETVEDRLTAIGSIQPNEEVVLKPEVAGRIQAIHFKEGERVSAGALLIELDGQKEAAQHAQAKAELALASENAARARQLAGTRAISKQEIDQLESQVTLKEAALEFSQQHLNDTQLTAPFDGILGPRAISAGQFVNVGTELVTLTDDSSVKITYQVPERHLAVLQTGQEVALRVSAYTERAFPGTVDLINPQVDENTRTVEVRALAPNPEGLLKAGMFARVETITGRRPEAIVVPETAVVPSLTGFAVFRVITNSARMTPVQTGMRLPGKVELLDGLKPGDQIIVGGLQKIVDGSPVNAHAAAPATEPSAASNP